jgi:hypothetical protein
VRRRRQSPGGGVALLADPRRRPSRSSTPDHTEPIHLVNRQRRMRQWSETRCDGTFHIDRRIIGTLRRHEIPCSTGQQRIQRTLPVTLHIRFRRIPHPKADRRASADVGGVARPIGGLVRARGSPQGVWQQRAVCSPVVIFRLTRGRTGTGAGSSQSRLNTPDESQPSLGPRNEAWYWSAETVVGLSRQMG